MRGAFSRHATASVRQSYYAFTDLSWRSQPGQGLGLFKVGNKCFKEFPLYIWALKPIGNAVAGMQFSLRPIQSSNH